jgi:hypothetical protein
MRTHAMTRALLLGLTVLAAALGTGCDDTVPPWQLDNDRIIAVRASSSQLAPGDRATLDILVTSEGVGPSVTSPQLATVLPPNATDAGDLDGGGDVPAAMARALTFEGGKWTVTAPSAAELEQLRAQLRIAADQPVPLLIGMQLDLGSGPLIAIKAVQLGAQTLANPALGAVTINGEPARDGLVLPADVDLRMSIDGTAEEDEIFWLSSLGDLSDEEDAVATLLHEPDDEDHLASGHIAVVVRDAVGGVTWGFWTASIAE